MYSGLKMQRVDWVVFAKEGHCVIWNLSPRESTTHPSNISVLCRVVEHFRAELRYSDELEKKYQLKFKEISEL